MAQFIRKTLYVLYTVLLTNGCQFGNQPLTGNTPPNPLTAKETIVFLGNPGAGKSALCNSIFQKPVFNSGVTLEPVLTTHKQEHMYQDTLYIDTPGLASVGVSTRKRAAEEIEKALKLNTNYKLVFVIALEGGRIKSADITTINLICLALAKVNFEYGLVINKVSKKLFDELQKKGAEQVLPKESGSTKLFKRPSSIIILKKEKDMEDENNKYFESNSENREKLLKFLKDLPAYKIASNQVDKIDVSIFGTK